MHQSINKSTTKTTKKKNQTDLEFPFVDFALRYHSTKANVAIPTTATPAIGITNLDDDMNEIQL
jgi:hypothetical protein